MYNFKPPSNKIWKNSNNIDGNNIDGNNVAGYDKNSDTYDKNGV